MDGVISIHAPRVGSDDRVIELCDIKRQFQSTLPVWGATNANLIVERVA